MTDIEQPLVHTDKPEIRIVLLGRSGEGKTASVNTILLKPKSEPCHTEECQKVTVNIDGQTVVVVDTPGLFTPGKSNVDLMKMIKESILEHAKPGPHVFLMVISVESTFTKELKDTAEILFQSFGKNTKDYTMVLFTRGDELTRNQTIQDFICSNTDLHNLIIQCHWKYHVFDNKDESHDQVIDLLQKINSMIETRGGCYYTCKMLKEAEKALKEEEQVQISSVEETSAQQNTVRTFTLLGTGAGCFMEYLFSGGEVTSSIAAAVGGIAGAILGGGSSGLVILAKNHIKKCR